jgi:hypothetical protein
MTEGSQRGRGYEYRFTRQRNAEALDGNKEKHDGVAVGFDEPRN